MERRRGARGSAPSARGGHGNTGGRMHRQSRHRKTSDTQLDLLATMPEPDGHQEDPCPSTDEVGRVAPVTLATERNLSSSEQARTRKPAVSEAGWERRSELVQPEFQGLTEQSATRPECAGGVAPEGGDPEVLDDARPLSASTESRSLEASSETCLRDAAAGKPTSLEAWRDLLHVLRRLRDLAEKPSSEPGQEGSPSQPPGRQGGFSSREPDEGRQL